jgi:hypothetical protein
MDLSILKIRFRLSVSDGALHYNSKKTYTKQAFFATGPTSLLQAWDPVPGVFAKSAQGFASSKFIIK